MEQKVEQGSKKEKRNLPAENKGSVSERFTAIIIREFSGAVGKLDMSPYQRRLAQHLFIKIDQSLKDLEKKRAEKDKDGLPIVWANINLEKLAIDSIHRIELGLDALIPNHISPIPYFNSRLKKYDLDLRIGYAGKDYYRRQMAVDPPENIIYELVHEKDVFKPAKASFKNPVESYEFEIPKPFDRGKVIGGFAYMVYGDPKKNRLFIVTEADFNKSKAKAQSKVFWDDYPEQMEYKTIVNRATGKIPIDPEKVNASFRFVEEQEDTADAGIVQAEIESKANKGDVINISTGEILFEEKKGVPEGGVKSETDEDIPSPEEEKAMMEKKGMIPKEKANGGQARRNPGF
jgi:recombination protein RecT